MEKLLRIFVEGSTDERFLTDLIQVRFGKIIDKSELITTGGWSNLFNEKNLNILQFSTDQNGVNIVIFDTDKSADTSEESFKIRRDLLIRQASEKNIAINLFLFPTNQEDGDIESLLQRIANPSIYEPVATCFEKYIDCLQKYDKKYQNETGSMLNIIKDKDRRKLTLINFLKAYNQEEKGHKRDYTDTNFWNLNSPALNPLIDFLRPHFL